MRGIFLSLYNKIYESMFISSCSALILINTLGYIRADTYA